MPVESRVLSVHIEKTAGTSIQDLLESVLGKNRVLIYDPIRDTLTRSADLKVQRTNRVHDALRLRIANTPLAPLINKAYQVLIDGVLKPKVIQVTNLPDNFAAIHGHFAANRFDQLITNPISAVVIRDPLERMESQYTHWQRTKGITEWRVRIPFDSALTFEDYALLPQLQNYQTQALGGKDLHAFAVVGVTNELDAFAQKLIRCLQNSGFVSRKEMGRHQVKWLNRTPQFRQSSPTYEHDFLRRFQQFHEKDYLLYEQAQERVKEI